MGPPEMGGGILEFASQRFEQGIHAAASGIT